MISHFFYSKRREAIARRHRIIEERKKKSTAKVAPTYRMETLSKDGAKDQGLVPCSRLTLSLLSLLVVAFVVC